MEGLREIKDTQDLLQVLYISDSIPYFVKAMLDVFKFTAWLNLLDK